MYRALESFSTKNYDVKRKQLLEEDFTTQEEIQEFLNIGYIEVYDGSLEITENGTYDVADYETADVNVSGGEVNLQNKTVTITTNGTQTISADSGYDGLESVAVTTNVAGSLVIPNGTKFAYSSSISDNFDTSQVQDMMNMFSYSTFATIPLINTSSATTMERMFYSNKNLVSVPQFNTHNVERTNQMFYNDNALTTVPVFDTSNVVFMSQMFSGCDNLTNESLNNILEMCINSNITVDNYKKLSSIGLSMTQAQTCTTLSNWAALSSKGWTTGY